MGGKVPCKHRIATACKVNKSKTSKHKSLIYSYDYKTKCQMNAKKLQYDAAR